MPQMSPLSWVNLMIVIFWLFFKVMSLIFFTEKKLEKSVFLSLLSTSEKFNFKW